jgi:8-oxo-dGTP diphosphatase
MSSANAPRHTGRGIVIHEDKLLLIERFRKRLHYFSIPGGGIEEGETPAETAVREIAEETTCVVRVVRPLYELRRGNVIHHIFLCEYVSGTPRLPAHAPEAQTMRDDNRFVPTWLPLTELRDAPFLVWQPIKRRLLRDLNGEFQKSVVKIVADPVS